MKKLLVATMNPGKIRELSRALVTCGIEAVGLDTLTDRTEVEETGTTFEANARLKAEGYSLRTDLPVLADDSGIEVDALNKEPGVYSARYGGPGLSDEDRTQHLLDNMKPFTDPEKRTARFVCVLAVAQKGDTLAVFPGVVEGRIAESLKGKGGFGYDPLFFHPPSGKIFAELSPLEKQAVSHRGQAVRTFLDALRSGDPRLATLVDDA